MDVIQSPNISPTLTASPYRHRLFAHFQRQRLIAGFVELQDRPGAQIEYFLQGLSGRSQRDAYGNSNLQETSREGRQLREVVFHIVGWRQVSRLCEE